MIRGSYAGVRFWSTKDFNPTQNPAQKSLQNLDQKQPQKIATKNPPNKGPSKTHYAITLGGGGVRVKKKFQKSWLADLPWNITPKI